MTFRITICGGGNAAHTLAGLLGGRPGLTVHVFAPFGREAEQWQAGILQAGGIRVQFRDEDRLGQPRLVSANPRLALEGADCVILALPAFAHAATLVQIAPYLTPGTWVGALPARGGFDLGVRAALGAAAARLTLFGFQTLPWACRIQNYGQSVLVLGTKEQVDVAAWPPEQTPLVAERLEALLGVRLNPIAGFLSLALADTGQIIHPGIMYGLFHTWDGRPYEQPRLFYQGVDAAAAATMEQMSVEVQTLRTALEQRFPQLDLSPVRPLHEWLVRSYGRLIADFSSLQTCFVTNRGYEGLTAPMRQEGAGYTPDFQARYLSEDVPYSLLVTRGVAELAGVSMPVIDRVLDWAQTRLGKEYLRAGRLSGSDLHDSRAPQRYGISRLETLLEAGALRGAAPTESVSNLPGGKS
jgi:hypothetical protein